MLIYPTIEFQVTIVDGGTINFSSKFNKINITIGEYVLNIQMIAITMDGVYVVLGVQWLQSLGAMDFNF